MTDERDPSSLLDASGLRLLHRTGVDRYGRSPEQIERERRAALELADTLRKVHARLAAGEVTLGREGGRRRVESVAKTARLVDRCAERDRLLLAAIESERSDIRATEPSEGQSAAPKPSGTSPRPRGFQERAGSSRISPESRSTFARERSQPSALAPLALVEAVLRELGPQPAGTLERLRAQAEAFTEEELAGFLERAAWHTAPEAWKQTAPPERAEWLGRNLDRWRELEREAASADTEAMVEP